MVGVCSKAQIRCGLLLNEYPAAHFNSEVAWAVMGMTKLLCVHTRDMSHCVRNTVLHRPVQSHKLVICLTGSARHRQCSVAMTHHQAKQ